MAKIKNKSSIAKIIISNFDGEKIKELKILHEKKAFLDILEIKKMRYDINNNKIHFEDIKSLAQDKLEVDISNTEELIVTLVNNEQILRKYKITGRIFDKSKSSRYKFNADKPVGKTVKIHLEILEHLAYEQEERIGRREKSTMTERKLLSKEVQTYYCQIAKCDAKDVDSKKIYQINKFLEYRSDLLFYFGFINNYFVEGLNLTNNEKEVTTEIWELLDLNPSKDVCEKIKAKMKANMVKAFEYNNNRIQNFNKKPYLSEDEKKDEIEMLTDEELKQDIKKILTIFSDLRHKIMHYEYKFFEKLFSGQEVDVRDGNKKGLPLSDLLNLNIFDIIGKTKEFKDESKVNYLTEKDKIRVLNKEKNAIKLLNLYNKICNTKPGFNNFINSFFNENGIENSEIKKFISEDFDKKISFLKTTVETEKIGEKNVDSKVLSSIKRELEFKEEVEKTLGKPYHEDIHYCKEYKKLYNEHKKLSGEVSQLIQKSNSKKEITEKNKSILALKNKMEKITKTNSKMRLEYKMRLAFGFLATEYNLDIENFKNNFKPDEKENFYSNWEIYLMAKPGEDITFDLKKMNTALNKFNDKSIVDNVPTNNLVKLYMLIYLLIPIEIRGDFLGNVKKHYYDIKNYSIDESNSGFYHHIRLFEKNIKQYEITKYSVSDDYEVKEYIEGLCGLLNVKNYSYNGEFLFNKTIILNILKYYQNIFKLMNDLEIQLLFLIDNNLEKALTSSSNIKGYLEFSSIYNKILPQNRFIIGLRNNIAHLDFQKLYSLEKLENAKKGHSKWCGLREISSKLDSWFEEINSSNTNFPFTFTNLENDYKMRLKHLTFNLEVNSNEQLISSKLKDKKESDNKILAKHKILAKDNENILKKCKEFDDRIKRFEKNSNQTNLSLFDEIEISFDKTQRKKIKELSSFEKISYKDDIIRAVSQEINLLLGIYKKEKIYKIKESLSNIFKNI